MTIIAICNTKGGTGKTTTAIFIATALSQSGHSVTVLDADPQGSATDWAIIAEENEHALPFAVLAVNARSLQTYKDRNGIAIIDCPPGNPATIDAALKVADAVIIPTTPSGIDVARSWETLDLIHDTPAAVLITSAHLGTNTLNDLQDALASAETATFTNIIVSRQAIKRAWGTTPTALYGYDAVADEILHELLPIAG